MKGQDSSALQQLGDIAMRKQNNIRSLELLRYLYLGTGEEYPAAIADML